MRKQWRNVNTGPRNTDSGPWWSGHFSSSFQPMWSVISQEYFGWNTGNSSQRLPLVRELSVSYSYSDEVDSSSHWSIFSRNRIEREIAFHKNIFILSSMNRILILIRLFFITILLLWVFDISRLWYLKLAFNDIQIFAEVPMSDSDGDGVEDTLDLCPLVKGTSTNHGCPELHIPDYSRILGARLSWKNLSNSPGSDSDADGITDEKDLCPMIFGTSANEWCPWISILAGIKENQCLNTEFSARGIMFASPVCTSCPCENAIMMKSLVRTCDVLFPAILSKDLKTVYSRGNLYLVH